MAAPAGAQIETHPLGQKLVGALDPDHSPVGWRFEAIEGTKVELAAVGKDGLVPVLRVWDEDTLQVIASATGELSKNGKSAKAFIKKLVVPRTGQYFVELLGAAGGPAGSFTIKSAAKLPMSVKTIDDDKKGEPGAPIVFEATAGLKLVGTVTGVTDAPHVGWLTVFGPAGALAVDGKAVKYDKKGKHANLTGLALPDTGLYSISSSDPSMALVADLSLKASKLKGKVEVAPGPTYLVLPAPVVDPHVTSTIDGSIYLEGSAPGASVVEIHGPAVLVNASVSAGRFAAVIPLKTNALNNLFLTARGDDSIDSPPATTQVTMDAQAPTLNVLFPTSQTILFDDTVSVSGQVGDSLSGHLGLSVSVNGKSGAVNAGIGTGGSFEVPGVPLNSNGPTDLWVTATDALGNQKSTLVQVSKETFDPEKPTLKKISGDSQPGLVNGSLPAPLVVRLTKANGTPLSGKAVTFRVARSDGRLGLTDSNSASQTTLGVVTDSTGVARVWWRLGADAGIGNNRVEVTSKDVQGAVYFCATADPEIASAIHVSAGSQQAAKAGAALPLPLIARVTDGVNPVSGVAVTFRVVAGGGAFSGAQEVVVESDQVGQAVAKLTLGAAAGIHRVEADFQGNEGQPAFFSARAVAVKAGEPTSFEGIVVDNAQRPIGGALLELKINSQTVLETYTDADGAFGFSDLDTSGVAELSVDGFHATLLDGDGIPAGTFPRLHFEDFLVVPGAANHFPTVRLPELANPALPYDGTKDVVLTCPEIEGLKMVVKKGSMTMPDGSKPSVSNLAWLSLNQVHFDEIPMPLPDGRTTRFAATLQPGGAVFDPPVYFEMPNMSGMAPGAITNLFSFNHGTGRFEIVGTGSVTEDGALIQSDPGSGLSLAGWHGNAPPPPPTGDTTNECQGGSGGGNAASSGDECSPCKKENQGKDLAALGKIQDVENAFAAIKGAMTNAQLIAEDVNVLNNLFLAAMVTLTVAIGLCGLTGPGAPVCILAAFATFLATAAGIIYQAEAKHDQIAKLVESATKEMDTVQDCIPKIAKAVQELCDSDKCYGGNSENPYCEYMKKKLASLKQRAGEVGAYLTELKTIQKKTKQTMLKLSAKYKAFEKKAKDLQCAVDPTCGNGGSAATDIDALIAEFIEEMNALNALAKQFSADMSELSGFLAEGEDLIASTSEEIVEVAEILRGDASSIGVAGVNDSLDLFGEFDIPGVPASDALVVARGEITTAEGPLYVRTKGYFEVVADTLNVASAVEFSWTLFPTPASIAFATGVGIDSVAAGATLPLQVLADMSNGDLDVDVTPPTLGTWYTTTNPAIATVDDNGVVTGASFGTAYITASNEGTTTVKRVDVVSSVVSTTLHGIVAHPDGSTIANAAVKTPFGDSTSTSSDGSFSLPISLSGELPSVLVNAAVTIAGTPYAGSASAAVVPGGASDVGIIEVHPQCTSPGWFAPVVGPSGHVAAMLPFEPTTGSPFLAVAGSFQTAGGVPAGSIAAWNGQQWSAMGGGVSGWVRDLCVYDAGQGKALYVGGWFASAGGAAAGSIARFDGQQWIPMPAGINGQVEALAVYDDGQGAMLYLAGSFTGLGQAGISNIARFDGQSILPAGLGLNGPVYALCVFDDGLGGGPQLYAGGDFTAAGGTAAFHIARFDGVTWSQVGYGTNGPVRCLIVHDANDGYGPMLYAGGQFTSASGVAAKFLARFDGTQWGALPSTVDGWVLDLAVHDDKKTGAPALFAAGPFNTAGGKAAAHIARFDGQKWTSLGAGLDNDAFALAQFDDGGAYGAALFVGGSFQHANGQPAPRFARWGCQ